MFTVFAGAREIVEVKIGTGMHTPRLLVGKYPGNAKHRETQGNAGENAGDRNSGVTLEIRRRQKCWRILSQIKRDQTGDRDNASLILSINIMIY